MGIHMAHYTMKGGSPLPEDSLCTVRLNGSPGPLPSRPLLASFHSPAFPPLSSVFIDLMADLSSPAPASPSLSAANLIPFLSGLCLAPGQGGVWTCLPPAALFSQHSDQPSWVPSLARGKQSSVSSDTR